MGLFRGIFTMSTGLALHLGCASPLISGWYSFKRVLHPPTNQHVYWNPWLSQQTWFRNCGFAISMLGYWRPIVVYKVPPLIFSYSHVFSPPWLLWIAFFYRCCWWPWYSRIANQDGMWSIHRWRCRASIFTGKIVPREGIIWKTPWF